MDPKIWGPSVWSSLIYIVAELPVNNIPSEQITQFVNLIDSLKELLPCPNCKLNFKEFLVQHSALTATATNERIDILKWLCLAYNHSKKTSVSLSFFINRHINKTIALKILPTPIKTPTQLPIKTVVKTPVQVQTKAPIKAPAKALAKAPIKTPVKAPIKAPIKTTAPPSLKSIAKTPIKTPVKTPVKAPTITLIKKSDTMKEPVPVRTPEEFALIQTAGIPVINNDTVNTVV